ncbi:hypothetical protein ACFV0L_04185 [Streptosporangium canum]|uniref:hypothetical protein n=1 Tax=Streptosporangium canum TaxID=324952 RepID=UPI0036963067
MRLMRLWREVRYLLVVLPASIATLVLLPLLAAGLVSTGAGGLGFVVVPRMMTALRRWAEWHRRRAASLLGAMISEREAMDVLYPAIDAVGRVLPGMVERGKGGLLFAGGLSAVMPMPAPGGLALSTAALRNYALTLNAALAGKGVYAGSLIIGGLIERGDIHRMVTSQPERFGDVGSRSLDPDVIADTAWDLYAKRDRPEATFSAFG